MPWNYKWSSVKDRWHVRPDTGWFGVHSEKNFRALIDREQGRVDRNAHIFSLVLFQLDNPRGNPRQVQRLVQELCRRQRYTDEVGFFDEHQIGVLLPETSVQGARKFADDILNAFAADPHPLTCTLHSYPEQIGPRGRRNDPRQLTFINSLGTEKPALPAEPRIASFEAIKPMLVQQIPGWKRGLDILGAALGLIVLSPLLVLIAGFIKLVSPGPAFYRQSRVGHLGQTFTCWKFRTMKLDSDEDLHKRHLTKLMRAETPMVKLDSMQDPRVIPGGKLLRLTGLDELPQLLNVLWGDMSLVGPRPCIEYESREYRPWQMRRFDTMPGLTGLWQVSGKNRTTFNQMLRLDISYTRRQSPWMDMKILFKTLPAIVGHVLFHSSKRSKENNPAQASPGRAGVT